MLEHKNGKRKVRIGFPGHETLAIWTLPVRNYVCIEPWCGLPGYDGVMEDMETRADMYRIQPGEEKAVQMTVLFG